jgi:hypothetical protein
MPDERTPPAVLITTAERGVVRRAVRAFVRELVPHLPAIAKFGGPAAVTFMLTTAHTWSEKAETNRKVAAAEVATKQAYKVLAKPTVEISAELPAVVKRLEAIEKTQRAQSAVIAAEHDFVIEGRPATKAQRRRVDAGLVKVVKDNAARDAKELAVRKTKPAPAITPIPLELPPMPTTAPPPLPQVRDAGRSS